MAKTQVINPQINNNPNQAYPPPPYGPTKQKNNGSAPLIGGIAGGIVDGVAEKQAFSEWANNEIKYHPEDILCI